jgi:hypothetical protein
MSTTSTGLGRAAFCLLISGLPAMAGAVDVFKCVQADGSVAFADRPCHSGEQTTLSFEKQDQAAYQAALAREARRREEMETGAQTREKDDTGDDAPSGINPEDRLRLRVLERAKKDILEELEDNRLEARERETLLAQLQSLDTEIAAIRGVPVTHPQNSRPTVIREPVFLPGWPRPQHRPPALPEPPRHPLPPARPVPGPDCQMTPGGLVCPSPR